MIKVKDIYNFIDNFAPFATAEDWDNCGILAGDPDAAAENVLVTLDVTGEVIKQAVLQKCELIVSHHPALYKPVKAFTKGNILYEAVKSGVSVISAHTNYDAAIGGVNDVLCGILDMKNITAHENLVMRTGEIKEQAATDFVKFLYENISHDIRYCLPEKRIKKIAVVGGSGFMFFGDAKEAGADAFLTGDAKYHDFIEAEENGIVLIAAGHYETENPAAKTLRDRLAEAFPSLNVMFADQKNPIMN
ncbi:MAG: Nif3-like dinuclear metal center hexameric protein [Oscillospiraceae bacterium]|nr:Nif3-like dinuclear metal center hexameric protein [Oscillospiraceae bacterium]